MASTHDTISSSVSAAKWYLRSGSMTCITCFWEPQPAINNKIQSYSRHDGRECEATRVHERRESIAAPARATESRQQQKACGGG